MTGPSRLRVDWPSCRARGLCHEVAPELIELDRWGYPLVRADVAVETRGVARDAVAICPRQALRLVP